MSLLVGLVIDWREEEARRLIAAQKYHDDASDGACQLFDNCCRNVSNCTDIHATAESVCDSYSTEVDRDLIAVYYLPSFI